MKSLHLLSLLLIASFAPAFSFSPSVKCRERHHELKASRRQILQTIASTTSLFVPSIAQAADVKSLSLQNELIEARVLENLLSPPTFGMEGNDIYYQSYFLRQNVPFVILNVKLFVYSSLNEIWGSSLRYF